MVWEYLQPVTIRFGEGVVGELKQVAGELGCHRGLLVSDPFFMKSGLAEKIENKLYTMISATPTPEQWAHIKYNIKAYREFAGNPPIK